MGLGKLVLHTPGDRGGIVAGSPVLHLCTSTSTVYPLTHLTVDGLGGNNRLFFIQAMGLISEGIAVCLTAPRAHSETRLPGVRAIALVLQCVKACPSLL